MATSNNIFLIGPMGAGKSTIGRLLAQELQWAFYDTDQEIERRTGVSVPWIFDIEGEMGFRQREENLITELSQLTSTVIATGGGSILSPLSRQQLADRGIVIYLTISLARQQERVLRNQNRPLVHTPNVSETLAKLQAERMPLYEQLAAWTFPTDNDPPHLIVQKILSACSKSYDVLGY